MKLGLYVGSFNPIHKDHAKIAQQLIQKKILDKVLFIPSKNYWDKNNLINIDDRIQMLKFYENEMIKVDSKRYQYDYTYEVIKDVKKQYLNADIYLIIGADNLEKFHLWKNVNDILQNKIIVINRNGIKTDKHINKFKQKENFIIINDIKTRDISSTEIRRRIINNEEVTDLLDDEVIKYIRENNLYERRDEK